jgi:hypothetical protein
MRTSLMSLHANLIALFLHSFRPPPCSTAWLIQRAGRVLGVAVAVVRSTRRS